MQLFDNLFLNMSKDHINITVAITLICSIWMERNNAKHNNIQMNYKHIIAKTILKLELCAKPLLLSLNIFIS